MTEHLTPIPITIYKQIYPKQCAKLASLGFRSLINIRPDAETASQPLSLSIQQSANEANLKYVHLPFSGERLESSLIATFATHYHQLPKPILLFCGTGTRAKLLYQSAVMQGLI